MQPGTGANSAITPRQVIVLSSLSVLYLLVSVIILGFKGDQVFLVAVFNILFYTSAITRKFVLGFSIFVVYWIVFDYMKVFPNYNYSPVHIADLYNFEKKLFGINVNGTILTPNEYWHTHGTTFLDILGGIFYLCWIPVPLGFAAYLFFTRRREFLYFSFTFVLVNFLGFIVYYLYPAAPPWYVQQHGFNFLPATHSNPAGLVKFDEFFNVGIFKAIYSKGSNVFAAMPSLHSAYPVIVLYYGLKNKLGIVNLIFGLVVLGIWFTAVYAGHHYIVDVIAGIVFAFCGIGLFNLLSRRLPSLRKAIDRYLQVIQ